MKLYIFAARDLHDNKPHIFYSEDFTDADIGNQYEVLKSFFVDWYDPKDSPFLEDEIPHYVRQFEGKYAIRIPKGDIITITDVDNGSFEFETGDFRFWVNNENYGFDIPLYMRCINSNIVASDTFDPDDEGYDDEEDEEEYIDEEEEYDPGMWDPRSEEWYIARDHGEDTDPYI